MCVCVCVCVCVLCVCVCVFMCATIKKQGHDGGSVPWGLLKGIFSPLLIHFAFSPLFRLSVAMMTEAPPMPPMVSEASPTPPFPMLSLCSSPQLRHSGATGPQRLQIHQPQSVPVFEFPQASYPSSRKFVNDCRSRCKPTFKCHRNRPSYSNC